MSSVAGLLQRVAVAFELDTDALPNNLIGSGVPE
jgi:hypothetical protein